MSNRFHLLSVPHTVANKEYISCAFTQEIIRFCKMLKSSEKGYKVYFYGHKDSEVECDEIIPIIDKDFLLKYYGEYDKNKLIPHGNAEADNIFNMRCIKEISKRKQKDDFILCFWGIGQKTVADQFPDCIIVEPGIGYPVSGIFAPYRVFVSYTYMHYAYGKMNIINGSWYDCVIPNYFDLNEFEYKEQKKDYMLYLGRMNKDKGVDICIQLAESLQNDLIIAGQGDLKSLGYMEMPKYVTYVGNADVEKRKELMSNAKCLLLPTYYIEPFGNVLVEALLSGTPIITTDWGAFNEINLHGITGYRCRTFEQFKWSVKNIHKIKPSNCYKWASENFSMERVKGLYEEYFDMLTKLHKKKGFYEEDDTRDNLDWLYKKYPVI